MHVVLVSYTCNHTSCIWSSTIWNMWLPKLLHQKKWEMTEAHTHMDSWLHQPVSVTPCGHFLLTVHWPDKPCRQCRPRDEDRHWSSNPANKQIGIWWSRSQECKHWKALSIPFALKKPHIPWKKQEWKGNMPKYNSYSIVSGFYFLLYISYISPAIFHNLFLNPEK